MLWNWETIDTCFLAESWKNDTTAKFAGSCIGVVLLTVALEFLRRLSKEYDCYLVRQHADRARDSASTARTGWAGRSGAEFFPNMVQQAIRALLHMVTFAVAYFVML
jgi:copper transporter 1